VFGETTVTKTREKSSLHPLCRAALTLGFVCRIVVEIAIGSRDRSSIVCKFV